MITKELINPKTIVVVGGSNTIQKPGGKVLKNLIDNGFDVGNLLAVNPKEDNIQGIKTFKSVEDLPQVDLAIIAIAAKYTVDTVRILAEQKNTKAFIILSAGYSEESEEGGKLEQVIVEIINKNNGSLIGPNCIGVMNYNYAGVFTTPIPKLDPQGVDFISGSGATAVFIMEAGIPKGLKFASVYSVGNSAQLGVEDVLEYMDESFDSATSPKVKLLYLESIKNPQKLLKHAQSLIQKGAKIAAIKSGASEAGSRAASSHTGALAGSDVAVDSLFRKAGIVRCYGREELTTVASVFMHPEVAGKNIAIITHAGGPAVMLTDTLSNSGLSVPHIEGEKADILLEKLFPGSAVGNPIDFLATGTAEQLGHIIDAVNNDFDHIDAMVVIFGSPGLFDVYDVYELLDEKMKHTKKPIFPVLPSIINVKDEIQFFIDKGRIAFTDEVIFGQAFSKVVNNQIRNKAMANTNRMQITVDTAAIRQIIDETKTDGYLAPEKVQVLLDAAGITRAGEEVATEKSDAIAKAKKMGYPIVMKVVGPVHKSDVGGVMLNIDNDDSVAENFDKMMKILDATGVLMQPMLSGTELFLGVKQEGNSGHLIFCGLGGIFVEVLKDVQNSIAPISLLEAKEMIQNLNGYKIIKGVRGQIPVNEDLYAEFIVRLSKLVEAAPEISEMDVNPLIAFDNQIVAVDARILLEVSIS
ncbi:MAG: acetate--CoA ligase family protein [Bacteroidales bacterium]|nr:acetate--CoA ligase family protein [Bacteroidales bacterium]